MTDKTGILLALAKEIRDGLGNDATASMRRRWAIELEALAEQPAGAVGEQPAEGAQGEADYWRGRAIVAERRNAVTPSAASVDVDAILEKLKDRVFQNHECPAESAAVWNTALYEMKGLIDSAGGAKVYQCPRCSTSMEVDPTAKPAPQPDGGDRAVLWVSRVELVTAVRRANDDRRVSSVRAYNCEEASLLRDATPLYTRPSAAAAVPEVERRHIERAIRVLRRDYESPLADAVESIYKQSLVAAPAAPKGGVVDEAMVERACAAFRKHVPRSGAEQGFKQQLHAAMTAALNPEPQP